MAKFVTASYGIVTRTVSTSAGLPTATSSDDPWIDVNGLSPSPVIGDHCTNGSFVLDHTSLSAAQGAKVAELRDACAKFIKRGCFVGQTDLGGFSGGRAYWYPTEAKDQLNLHIAICSALASEQTAPNALYALWCGVGETPSTVTAWDMRDHTASHAKRAGIAVQEHITNGQFQLKDSIAAVFAATTEAAVSAIVWEDPPG